MAGFCCGYWAFDELFGALGCESWLCVLPVDGRGEVSVRAGELVVSVSVLKVAVALEARCQIDSGWLDACDWIRLGTASRTPGPTGFSIFSDDVEVPCTVLIGALLRIGENAAMDVVLERVRLDRVSDRMARLGFTRTVIVRRRPDRAGTPSG